MKKITAVCFVFIIMVACSKADRPVEKETAGQIQPQIPIKIDYGKFGNTETNQKIAMEVYAHFAERVRGKGKIESIDIILNYYEPSPYDSHLQVEYGWSKEIEVIIKISRDDKTIYEGLPMMGNNLFYYFGGGKRPGMFISKPHAIYFYGFKKDMVNSDGTVFVNDAFYKIIDGLELE